VVPTSSCRCRNATQHNQRPFLQRPSPYHTSALALLHRLLHRHSLDPQYSQRSSWYLTGKRALFCSSPSQHRLPVGRTRPEDSKRVLPTDFRGLSRLCNPLTLTFPVPLVQTVGHVFGLSDAILGLTIFAMVSLPDSPFLLHFID